MVVGVVVKVVVVVVVLEKKAVVKEVKVETIEEIVIKVTPVEDEEKTEKMLPGMEK